MIKFNADKKAECCGCTACAERCPVGCITMEKDKLGFAYPHINASKCIDCGICERVCPELNEFQNEHKQMPDVYAAVSSDLQSRMDSSSGGLFWLIARQVILQGGVVFGAAFDESFHSVKHTVVDSVEDLHKIQGSKYLQSNMNSAYKKAEEYLKQGKTVLFSGTPCQTAGLKRFLSKDYEELFLLNVVCHGVPAPGVWDEYLSCLEKKQGQKVKTVSFRDKRQGWNDYLFAVAFDDGREYTNNRSEDLYMRGFLHNLYLRPSCYECNYKYPVLTADITLGDLWGADELCPDLADNKGTSLVILSSPKGRAVFENITSDIEYRPLDIADAIRFNGAISSSARQNPKGADFEKAFGTRPVSTLLKRFCSRGIFKRIKQKIKKIIG